MMPIVVHGRVPRARVDELDAYVRDQRITEHVFLDADGAGLRIDEVIHMDEYTLDLLVPLPDGLVLVYDTT